ncbi:hypothetical protein BDA96_02G076000 [Sorghum bicolor]|jgi:hypothetical protein|uniref:Uncharacterized protein n=2 Tax=Sorghum bicolor TaxID=4558 RepID=A0A921RMF2_SORBI|nr:hypothetical protein BDA96_02G076000 [Sorghum bicolor]KXG34663.1 hypothetical protein SORBI_3002G074100 [Sorghum bicolor]
MMPCSHKQWRASRRWKPRNTSTACDFSVGGGLFSKIHSFLQESFNCLNVCKISKFCNSFAHNLASLGMSWDPGQFCIWTDPSRSL